MDGRSGRGCGSVGRLAYAALVLGACGGAPAAATTPVVASTAGDEAPLAIAEIVAQRVHRGPPDAYAVSPDGRLLVTSSRYLMALTDVASGVVLTVSEGDLGPDARTPWLGFDARGEIVFGARLDGYGDESAFAWRIEDDRTLVVGDTTSAAHAVWLDGPDLLVTARRRGGPIEAHALDSVGPAWTVPLDGVEGWVGALALSADERLLAVATDCDVVALVEVEGHRIVRVDGARAPAAALECPDESAREDDPEEDLSDPDAGWSDAYDDTASADVPGPDLEWVPTLFGFTTEGGVVASRGDRSLTLTTPSEARTLATGCEDGSVSATPTHVEATCDGVALRVDLRTGEVAPTAADASDDDVAPEARPEVLALVGRLASGGEYSLWSIERGATEGLVTQYRDFAVTWTAAGAVSGEGGAEHDGPYDASDEPRSCDVRDDEYGEHDGFLMLYGPSGEAFPIPGSQGADPRRYHVAEGCAGVREDTDTGARLYPLLEVLEAPIELAREDRLLATDAGLFVVARGAAGHLDVYAGSARLHALDDARADEHCALARVVTLPDREIVLVRTASGLTLVDDAATDAAGAPAVTTARAPLPADACEVAIDVEAQLVFAASPSTMTVVRLPTAEVVHAYARPGAAAMSHGHLVECGDGRMTVYDRMTGARRGSVPGACRPSALTDDEAFVLGQGEGRGRAYVQRVSDGAGLTLLDVVGAEDVPLAVSDDGAVWAPSLAHADAVALGLTDGTPLTRTTIAGEAMRARFAPTLLADFFEGRPLPTPPALAVELRVDARRPRHERKRAVTTAVGAAADQDP